MYHIELSITYREGHKTYHQFLTDKSQSAVFLAARLKKYFTRLVESDIVNGFEIVLTSDFDTAEMERVNAK